MDSAGVPFGAISGTFDMLKRRGFLLDAARTRRRKLLEPKRFFGQIEILEKFWNLPSDPKSPQIAPAILVYADLMATLEPRNSKVARIIWEARIEAAFTQT